MKKHSLRTLFSAILTICMLVSMIPAAIAANTGETHLTIIGTSDIHGNVWGYSYEDMKETAKDGMARISTYVNSVRAENPNTILVDNGDTIQGTIMTDDLYSKSSANHPVIAAMNYMKYDAWTMGNHEFNWGTDNLKAVMAQSKAPALAANVKNADGTLFTGTAYTIVERGGVKVAVIGVVTPNIPRWDGSKKGISDLNFAPLADGVAEAVKAIGDKADVIMVCAHAGLESEYTEADAAQTILDKCPEVDVLQLGHTHATYINNDGPIPVAETKNGAGEVVRYDLTLDSNKSITSATVKTVTMDGIAPDQALRDVPAVKEAQEKTVSFIKDNVLGHASADFQPVNEIAGLPEGRLQDTAVMDLIATVQLENTGADVTGAALFKDTSDLKKGDLNYGNLFDIYKYPNVLYTVKVTGAEMKAYMEWAAACYNTWKPGDINISFNAAKPGYLHDHFAGLTYEVNLSKPEGQRIENVVFKGQPLKDDQELILCVNDYRFSGLKTAGIIHGEKLTESSASVRDMLVAYLAKHDPLEPKVDNNWKITGVDLQLDNPARAAYVAKINSGELAAPYYKGINLNEANNVVVNGKLASADAAVSSGLAGVTFYRLRDLAVALKGTDAAFNVEWNKGVIVTKGGAYAADSLPARASGTAIDYADITATVDGAPVEISALLIAGNYYVSADSLTKLLGVTASEAGGVLTVTAKPAASTSGQGG